jgi:hypothetical protein
MTVAVRHAVDVRHAVAVRHAARICGTLVPA